MGIILSGLCGAYFQVTGKGDQMTMNAAFPLPLWGAELRLNSALFSQLPTPLLSMFSI